MRLGSLFSGIGGFDLAFRRAGFDIAWQVEIDSFCRQILSQHFQETERFEDVRKAGKHNLEPVDIVCGGFPCQDLSVAGRRQGLAGERSGLFYEFARIVDELLPQWIVVENVPGLLSSPTGQRGRDMQIVLGELTGFWTAIPERGWKNSGVCSGPKRTIAWRVLDSRYFGVAQRRRRVFFVAGPRRSSAFEVLLNATSGAWDLEKGGKERANVAAAVTGGVGRVGSRGADDGANIVAMRCVDQDGYPGHIVATLNSGGNNGGFRSEPGEHLVSCFVTENIRNRSQGPANYISVRHHANHKQAESQQSEAGRSVPSVERECASANYSVHGADESGRSNVGDERGTRLCADESWQWWKDALAADPTQNVSEALDGQRMRETASITDRLDCSGWEDYHAKFNPKGQDSARYRALGNAVTVSVMEWIARRIVDY